MDSIITIDQDPSVEMKSQSMHNHNNPFDVSLFTDNAKIRRIPLFAYDEDENTMINMHMMKMVEKLLFGLILQTKIV